MCVIITYNSPFTVSTDPCHHSVDFHYALKSLPNSFLPHSIFFWSQLCLSFQSYSIVPVLLLKYSSLSSQSGNVGQKSCTLAKHRTKQLLSTCITVEFYCISKEPSGLFQCEQFYPILYTNTDHFPLSSCHFHNICVKLCLQNLHLSERLG